jgi:hypothetical protein
MECQVRNRLTEAYLHSQAKLERTEQSWQDSEEANGHVVPIAVALARKNVINLRRDLVDHCRKHGC